MHACMRECMHPSFHPTVRPSVRAYMQASKRAYIHNSYMHNAVLTYICMYVCTCKHVYVYMHMSSLSGLRRDTRARAYAHTRTQPHILYASLSGVRVPPTVTAPKEACRTENATHTQMCVEISSICMCVGMCGYGMQSIRVLVLM